MRSFNFSQRNFSGRAIKLSWLYLCPTFGVLLHNLPVHAQSSANKPNTDQAVSDGGFTVSDAELEKERTRLLEAEKALLKELAAQAPANQEKQTAAAQKVLNNSQVRMEHVNTASTREPLAEETTLAAKKANLEAVKDSVEVSSATKKSEEQAAALLANDTDRALPAESVKASAVKVSDTTDSTASDTSDNKLESLRKINIALQNELKATRIQLNSMQREMEDSRSRLMISQTEVDRLSGALRTRNTNTVNKYISDESRSNYSGNSKPVQMVASRTLNSSAAQRAPLPVTARSAAIPPAKPAEEVMVATVTAEKANLRTGPSKDNSPLMNVSQGTRLVVETRQGEWYRVVAPTGARAWVSADVLGFGDTAQSSPTRTINIAGYTRSAEDEAFKLIQRGTSR